MRKRQEIQEMLRGKFIARLSRSVTGSDFSGSLRPHFSWPAQRLIMKLRLFMSLEQAILEAVRALPAEKQQEVLNHAARLRDEAGKKSPFKSIKGLWADLGISLSPKEIEENQREMWRNFPREDI
jgi:hypothetical protein